MNNVRKLIAGLAIGASAITGAGIGAAMVAGAASADTTTTTPAASASDSSSTAAATPPASTATPDPAARPPMGDPSKGGHVGTNGVKEVVLTGDTATKVQAAALAAVPGATILRVENDAEGATYEAHITKADGTMATVKLDASFKVTSIEDGMK